MYEIEIEEKLSDLTLDNFMAKINNNFNAYKATGFLFDLSKMEYAGNQELLVFTGLLKTFYESKIPFKILFLGRKFSTQISDRTKRQIIQLWEVWKIYTIIENKKYDEYFDINPSTVKGFQKELAYYPKKFEIFTRHGITPFAALKEISNFNENQLKDIIAPIYNLNRVIIEMLSSSNCDHPFTTKAFSAIITTELYLNFLEHSQNTHLKGIKKFAFMSISFEDRVAETETLTSERIQKQKKLNFETECLLESKSFYYDNINEEFKNIPYVQFSFLDFGQGIVNTLRDIYEDHYSDSEVLKNAFNHNSSRHSLDHDIQKYSFIPRGLFDVISFTRKYKGLLVARSNYGKVLFDFSNEQSLDKAYKTFGSSEMFFPGTLISVYIPAHKKGDIDLSVIKPSTNYDKIRPTKKNIISVNKLLQALPKTKENYYSQLFSSLKLILFSSTEPTLNYISFNNSNTIERRVIKKIIYFLLTNYEVNYTNSVIIIDFKDENLLAELSNEILVLSEAEKTLKIHPLPVINFDNFTKKLSVHWIGIYDSDDAKKLNLTLLNEYSLSSSDFSQPWNVTGHLNYFDQRGNLYSLIPNQDELIEVLQNESIAIREAEVKALLTKNNCVYSDNNSLYACKNYLQKEFIELNSIISNNNNDFEALSKMLLDQIIAKVGNINNYVLIVLNSLAEKIVKQFNRFHKSRLQFIVVDNIQDVKSKLEEDIIAQKKYILICDLLVTGNKVKVVNDICYNKGAKLSFVAVIVSTLDSSWPGSEYIYNNFKKRLICLYSHPIPKFTRKELAHELAYKSIVRINPYTNIPVRLNLASTNYNETVLFKSYVTFNKDLEEIEIRNDLISSIKESDLMIGFLIINNLIHPYYFNTYTIIKNLSEEILKVIIDKIEIEPLNNVQLKAFYPRRSGASQINKSVITRIIGNYSLEFIELDRHITGEGWKFPHNLNYLNFRLDGDVCLVIDDGSCTGDTLIQMMIELSFFPVKKIIVICFISRISDHKREFFSRLSNLKGNNGEPIEIKLLFVSHWHIPTYYLESNPCVNEINWLKLLQQTLNAPISINKIVSKILGEIQPQKYLVFKEYKYLPKDKLTGKIPKKDMLLVREEIGKVIGHRLYEDSFDFFNYFLRKYDNDKGEFKRNRYKEIELLCCTLIYEPYLYPKLRDVLPDVVEKLEDFIWNVIFNKDLYSQLTYSWSKKDIIHLFFIVFKDDKLINKLEFESFVKLIGFTQPEESSLNYVLYKLLTYLPISKSQLEDKKFDNEIRIKLIEVKDKFWTNKDFKRFYNFIQTLPRKKGFNSQLTYLRDHYKMHVDTQYHNKRKSFNHNVTLIKSNLRDLLNVPSDANEDKIIDTIQEVWYDIQDFINPLLEFCSTFPEYIAPYTYDEFQILAKEIRGWIGMNEKLLAVLHPNRPEDIVLLLKNIDRIKKGFGIDSNFYNLICYPDTQLNFILKELVDLLNTNSIAFNNELVIAPEIAKSRIPQIYAKTLIVNELVTNISKWGPGSVVHLKSTLIDKEFILEVTNSKEDKVNLESNSEGSKCLQLLSIPLFGFKYKSIDSKLNFHQILKFNITYET